MGHKRYILWLSEVDPSHKVFSRIVTSALAPVPSFAAFSATLRSAASVKCNLMP